jgi:hypothetical protein
MSEVIVLMDQGRSAKRSRGGSARVSISCWYDHLDRRWPVA